MKPFLRRRLAGVKDSCGERSLENPYVHLYVFGHGRCFSNSLRLGKRLLDDIPNSRRFDDLVISGAGSTDD
jgi:hypothetical protein